MAEAVVASNLNRIVSLNVSFALVGCIHHTNVSLQASIRESLQVNVDLNALLS